MSANVLALGAGAMGTRAARTLAAFSETAAITVADLDIRAAERAALACAGKGRAVAVDVTDPAGLRELLGGFDVVMNCVGPFFRFGVPILQAAIEAGVDYLDICDDPAPTRDMLELDASARQAGVTAVIGMGASPGVNNLLGAQVRARLDVVDSLAAAWNIEESTGDDGHLGYSAALVHWLMQCSGSILECEAGALVEAKPLRDVVIDYPGRGRRTLYTVGHPEPVSFHVSWPEVKKTFCAMVMPSAWIGTFRKYQGLIDGKEKSLEDAAKAFHAEASAPSWIDGLMTALSRLVDGPRLPYFFVLGQGTRAGKPRTVAASITAIPGDMAGATGVPLALGTLLHLRGRTRRQGVMAPEIAFEPGEFFELFAPYCVMPRPVPADRLVEVVEA